jgi:CheY-like chemotaxis protein
MHGRRVEPEETRASALHSSGWMALVLIIDDSEDLQETLQMVLTDHGFEVAGALDGERGLQLTRNLHPDVILVDMMMPEMDGLEFLSRLSSEPSQPPVVANSGFDGYRAEARRRGALAFLLKPLSIETLVDALRSAIERQPVPPAALASNEACIEQERRRAREATDRAVARLDAVGLSKAREGLRGIAHWLPTYLGFGTCLVHVLRGEDVCIEAVHNGPAQLYEGLRYPRDTVYCDDVITAGSTLVLTDPEHHPSEHFSHHKEIAAGYRFYVGTPLKAPSGAVFGTLCVGDTLPHEFHTEDMRVLQSLGRGAARGLELGSWPLDEQRTFECNYRQLFVDAVVERAVRPGGAGIVMTISSQGAPPPEVTGLAAVRLDEARLALLWGGKAGTWSPPGALGARVLAAVELSGLRDAEMARAQVHAILA